MTRSRGVARRQLDLLRSARDFRLLFLASIGSSLGTRLAVLALMVDVWDRTESAKWVAALLVADFLPVIVIGLLLGSVVDRLSRRRLMIASDVVRAGLFCILPFAGSALAVVVLAAGVGFATGLFRPAVYAGLPNLVDDDDLPTANGLFQAAENITWMLGPLAGGALLTVASTDAAYWFNAATFAVSALVIARIAERVLQAQKAPSEGHLRDVAAGFRLVARSRALLTVLVGWGLVALATGNSEVAEVALAKVAFDSGNFGLGLLMGASGLGLVVGSLGVGAITDRVRTSSAYAGSIALVALGLGAAAASPNVWSASAFAVAIGLGNGVAVVINSVLVQRGAPDHLRGRAFTLVMSATYATVFVGMLTGGFLADAVGPRWTWAVAGAIVAVAAAAAYVLGRGLPREAAVVVTEPVPLPVVSTAPGEARAAPD